ncbi:hypothetical protein [Streptomyces sp. NPDC059783]|uniref:DUF7848 domain-containing protein n=1 Tax=Streptomyces sp. NPDC059783 TaxID=3346944 RepID=UPI003668397F
MSSRTIRYVPFTVEQDPLAEPEYAARCVSGAESECGADSATYNCPQPVEEWQRRHAQETGHRRFRRNFGDYAVMRPPEGLVASKGHSGMVATGLCEHRRTEARGGMTYCGDCGRQLCL